jgi:hypothetical protein
LGEGLQRWERGYRVRRKVIDLGEGFRLLSWERSYRVERGVIELGEGL